MKTMIPANKGKGFFFEVLTSGVGTGRVTGILWRDKEKVRLVTVKQKNGIVRVSLGTSGHSLRFRVA